MLLNTNFGTPWAHSSNGYKFFQLNPSWSCFERIEILRIEWSWLITTNNVVWFCQVRGVSRRTILDIVVYPTVLLTGECNLTALMRYGLVLRGINQLYADVAMSSAMPEFSSDKEDHRWKQGRLVEKLVFQEYNGSDCARIKSSRYNATWNNTRGHELAVRGRCSVSANHSVHLVPHAAVICCYKYVRRWRSSYMSRVKRFDSCRLVHIDPTLRLHDAGLDTFALLLRWCTGCRIVGIKQVYT